MGACTQRKIVKNTIRKKCIHCGQLILRKINKIGATTCQILRLQCTKFDFCWGCGSLQRSPDSLVVFKEPTSKERERERGRGREGEREEEGKGKGKGKVGEGR